MKIIIERTKFEEQEHYWDIGFDITDEDGVKMYVPITVFKRDLIVANEVSAMEYAFRMALPGQIVSYYSTKPIPQIDFFDTINMEKSNV